MEADKDGDGKISFEEFCDMVANTVLTSPPSSFSGLTSILLYRMLLLL